MNFKNSLEKRNETLFLACLLGLVASYTAWQLFHLGGWRWDWDEGAYLLTAQTVARGYRLYSDIFSTAPPLFIASLNLGFWVGGETITAGRAVIVLYSALGLLGVGLLAREWGGRLAGPVAVATLAVAPHFYILSRTVVANLPSMGLACLALWMAVRYGRSGRRRWLAAAGWTLGCSLCLKPMAGLVLPAIVLVVLLRDWQAGGHQGRPVIAKLGDVCYSGVIMASSFAAPIAFCLLTHEVGPMVEQVVTLLWTRREYFTPDYGSNAASLFRYLLARNTNIALNRGLTILGLAGSLLLAWRRSKDALVLGLWLATTVVVITGYAPLWDHLLVPLLFPLAVAAGIAVEYLFRTCKGTLKNYRQLLTGPRSIERAFAIGLTLALAAYVHDLPGIVSENDRHSQAQGDWVEEAVRHIQNNTATGDFVITDEPLLAFLGRRPVPPNLTDCSNTRIAIRKLTTDELIHATERYRPKAVILGNRIKKRLPDYVEWVESRYTLIWTGRQKLYVARDGIAN